MPRQRDDEITRRRVEKRASPRERRRKFATLGKAQFDSLSLNLSPLLWPPPFPPAFARPPAGAPGRSLPSSPPLSHRILFPFGISSVLDSSRPVVAIFLSLFFLLPLSHLVAADNTPDYPVTMKYRTTSGAIARVVMRSCAFHLPRFRRFFIVQRHIDTRREILFAGPDRAERNRVRFLKSSGLKQHSLCAATDRKRTRAPELHIDNETL